ncbi:TPA: ATP-binding protein, partial [Pseudomonas aeruginosa]
ETYRTDGKAEKAAVLEACREYAERFVENFQDGRCLLLLGNLGTGKTHLACSIVQYVVRNLQAQAVITSASEIIRVAKGAMNRAAKYTERDALEELAGFDLLV